MSGLIVRGVSTSSCVYDFKVIMLQTKVPAFYSSWGLIFEIAENELDWFTIGDKLEDASPTGLSAILMESPPGSDDKRVVAYASHTLTAVERCYSQTEKEALAIVGRAIEKLHIYLCGCRSVINSVSLGSK